ncbi:uncharacterized protein WCC33_014801 [Rhinophrynus dorsalis]
MAGQLKPIEGVPLAEDVARNWEEIKAFQARPEDILIGTFPKSGTSWIQEIVDLILHEGDEEICRRPPLFVRMPFLELLHLMEPGIEEVNAMPSPRVLKTHLAVQLVPKSFWEQTCKVIYVARNAKDTLTSYYHFDHMLPFHPDPGTFEEYLQRFMKGAVGWGSWYDHVKGFWEKKDKHRILYLFYEDLKQNPVEEVRKVMKFLDKDLSEDVLKKIAHLSSFNQMKDNPMANNSTFPSFIIDQSKTRFMRKGLVGDWKNHFTVRQNEIFEEDYRRQMSCCSLKFLPPITFIQQEIIIPWNLALYYHIYKYTDMAGKLKIIEGIPMAEAIITNWQQIRTFQARPSDILIDTYPKSGTTWVEEIVDLIMHEGDETISRNVPNFERVPFIEMLHLMKPGTEEVNVMPSPRVLKSHLPVQLVPPSFWQQKCKVIYVARNARDTVTSYYHFDHMVKIHPDPGTFEEYLQKFMKGDVGWGSWYDHVKGFWEERNKHNILYIFFEDVKRKPLEEIRKLMKFLDKDLSEDVLKKIAHLCDFKQMKANPMANYSTFPSTILDQSRTSFMRKGKVGDWKTLFTVHQNELFEEDYNRQMSGSSLKFQTTI